jgi:7-cyano-7-deazaguanine synthase
MIENKTVVLLALSGGMDSATLLGYYLSNNYNVLPISFYYGSKHNKYESICVEQLLKHYKINTSFKINLDFIGNIFKSNLLHSGDDIPEGHYEDKNMKLTVVPGRNLIFASILAGIAESYNADIIALGVHSGDHEIYPDCRKEFIDSLNKTIQLSSDGKVGVQAPFINFHKKDILKIGYNLDDPFKVPYEYTRTCYKDQVLSCGCCGSCSERLEAFEQIGKIDPIEYHQDYY